jgi:hypothetical protein
VAGDGTSQVRPVDADDADPGADGVARRLAWLCAFVAGVVTIGVGLATTYLGREFVDGPRMAWGVVQLLAFAAPWVVGAALLQIRPRWGTAVLVAFAGLTSLELVPTLLQMLGDPASDGAVRAGGGWLALAGYSTYPFMLGAGAAAFVGRPRGGWTTGPAVHPLVAVPIAGSYLTAFLSPVLVVSPSRPGEPITGWFPTAFGSQGAGEPWIVAHLAITVVSIIALSVAVTRLRAGIAGAVLLGIAIPGSVASIVGITQMRDQPGSMVSPAAYVAAGAAVALVVIGVRWVREDPEPPGDA